MTTSKELTVTQSIKAEIFKAENDRIEAEKNQKAYELAKREADKKHIATINGNAAVCLADIDGVDYDTGVKIIEAIAKGLIHNVKVSY